MQEIQMSWQWIAGFFEGEGSVYWIKPKPNSKQGMFGRVVIGQKEKEPLTQIVNFLKKEGLNRAYITLRRQNETRPGMLVYRDFSEIWILSIQQRDEVLVFLKSIQPFLIQKNNKAMYVINELARLRDERDRILEQGIILRSQSKSWPEVCNILGVGYRSIMNYAKSKGIDLKIKKFDPKKWRDDRVNSGNCRACGKPRDGRSKYKCTHCIEQYNEYKRMWRERRKLASLTDSN